MTLTLVFIAEVLLLLLLNNKSSRVFYSTILSNIITVSGIFSGIVIAYLASKVFQTREEYERRKVDIDHLSIKLTNFRKLLYYVMNSDTFWIRKDDITQYKKIYGEKDFDELHFKKGDSKSSSKFWLEEKSLSRTTIDLYLSMDAIFDDSDKTPLWVFDRAAKFDYSLDQIRKYYNPSNQIWYYLQGRYEKHTRGLINDAKLNRRDECQIREHAALIDPKFKNRDVDKDLIAEVATEFYEIILPKLFELSELNQMGMPKGMKQMLVSIIWILIFGVIAPLFFSIFPFDDDINVILSQLSGSLIILLFINFVFDFNSVIKSEIQLKN